MSIQHICEGLPEDISIEYTRHNRWDMVHIPAHDTIYGIQYCPFCGKTLQAESNESGT